MPALNWDVFKGLPGSAETNFEQLCRGIVRQNFGSFGAFRALANQPGVEFHVKLEKKCESLGDPGRWWGWQCKWYEIPAHRMLGATRRAKIEEALRKTEAYLPDLTDWVLWTRYTLTKRDQEWFYGLSSKMKLHLWTWAEIDNFLSGQASILRSTYFGELVLTPDILQEWHEQAVAPIRKRWQPDVHHVGEAERQLRRVLGEFESWKLLGTLSSDLRSTAQAVDDSEAVPSPLAPFVTNVAATSRKIAGILDRVAEGIRTGDLDMLRDELSARPPALTVEVATAPRRLRSANLRAGLYATNAVACCHEAIEVLGDVETAFSSRVVGVLAPAGCGKTQLAAQLTSGTPELPHGVLLHGRDLHATHNLNDLARRLSIGARPVPSMEALIAAVDAAGQRARQRLPVFIDGLNESEDPRTWKPLLASLEATLTKYPYVLLVCALRPEFVDDALPDGVPCLEIMDYGEETIEAVREHFRYWKIDGADASLPGFLRHPLTLRLFCEVTNPTRQKVVGVSAMPGSLTTLFDRYLEQVGSRVVDLASRENRFYSQDVNAAISMIARKLWEQRTRAIEFGELRSLLDDAQRPWDQSLVRALEHEGILLRMPSNGNDAFIPVYDLLGGHIIAKALIAKQGQSSFEAWIKTSAVNDLLSGDYDARHPLADDIVRSMVGQIPRLFSSTQLWQMVDEPLRERALRLAATLEPASLDAATVDELVELVRKGDDALLQRLWEVRGSRGHPLNAEGLDQALRDMTVADRDLRWTEWLRKNQDDLLGRGRSVLGDLERLEQRWKSGKARVGNQLRARWVMWTLTSTVRRLRDQATRTLYWFGRVDPGGLFVLTIDSLAVNDAYVSERMLAASYGVVMSRQSADAEFEPILTAFLEQLASGLAGTAGSAPTYHYLARLYVRGIVAFAMEFYPSSVPISLKEPWSFAAPSPIQPLIEGDPRAEEAELTLHMDFKNYTLGRLFDDRGNYDMTHAGHQAAVAHVRGVVWALGWRKATFETVDGRIAEFAYRYGRGTRPPTERYGKKYGWIGFFTYAGTLEERGQLPLGNYRISDLDIDPSFPEAPPSDDDASIPDAWLAPSVGDHEKWMREGAISIPRTLLLREVIDQRRGPWLAVHGFVKAADRVLGREVWAFISALATDRASVQPLCAALNAGTRPWVARDTPSDYYTFAGEIPWHPHFASVGVSGDAYGEKIQVDPGTVNVEVLAHEYAWGNSRSEINQVASALVPSRPFSHRFSLRSAAQTFDQFLHDGSRATITLSGVDGLQGDILYIREDLLHQYIEDRTILWCVFGEKELHPFPSSPPEWLVNAYRRQANSWCEVLTEADFKQRTKAHGKKTTAKRRPKKTKTKKKPPNKKVSKRAAPKRVKKKTS